MKHIFSFLAMSALLAGCTSFGSLGKQMDSKTLPLFIAVREDSTSQVKIEIEKTTSITGIPELGCVPKKSQYVVPLPFVGFFGAKALLQPGEKTIVSPMYSNLEAAIKGEMEGSYPKNLKNKYTLKLKVDSSNFTFNYYKKGVVIWFFISIMHKKEYCSPSNMSITTSYELLENGITVKKNSVTKTKHSEEKIFSTTPIPAAKPYDMNDPFDTQAKASVRAQDQFAFGGAAGTIAHGFSYNLAQYNILIQDLAKQIIEETKASVK